MVHALKRIHGALRPEGVLLDLHPQPENAGVEVWQGSRVERLGYVEQDEDIREILEARARLDLVVEDGWYITQQQEFFDLISHFPSPEDWLEFQAQEGYTGVLPKEILASASHLLATGGGEFIVREPIRASLHKPLPRPDSDHSRDGEDPTRRG